MKIKTVAPLFYFGTLISSVGSFTFNLSLIAFMLQNEFHLAQASLIIGLQRLVPIIVTGIWGHLTDRLSPRGTVAVAESIAAVTSVILLVIWNGTHTNYSALLVTCVIRAVVVAFQMGSRAKITKLLSDDTYANNSKHAIWFNKATQGATLFGGLIAWIIIRHANLQAAIIFDAVSFLLNGVIVLLIPNLEKASDLPNEQKVSWHTKFHELFHFNKKAAVLDILLAVSMMGTVAFMARLAREDQSWAALYLASFGLAVWIAGFLERGVTSKIRSFPFWIILGGSFILLGQLPGPGIATLSVFFIKDLAYWIILHRISGHIQMDTPSQVMGSVFSARTSIMIAILAVGEISVGAWSNVIPVSVEALIRGLLAIVVGACLLMAKAGKVTLNDRPAL